MCAVLKISAMTEKDHGIANSVEATTTDLWDGNKNFGSSPFRSVKQINFLFAA
jgi:hypothetical protein